MNILHLINYAGSGGTEKYVLNTTKALLKKKHRVHFIYNEKGPLFEQIQRLGIIPVRLRLRHPFDLLAAKTLAAYCKVNQIDLIHCHFLRENYIALLAKKIYPVKVIYTAHIITHNKRLIKLTNRLLTGGNAAIVAVCQAEKQALIENKLPENKIKVIYNGVDLSRKFFMGQTITNGKIRREFNIAEDEFVFVCLTRFSEEKAPLFLLQGAQYLKRICNKKFRVIFCGEGPLLEEAKTFVATNNLEGTILLAGYRNDAEEVLMASDAFVNSSQNEALSLAILEAMSNSLPIIASAVGGNTEVINSTNCGLLVPFNDVHALGEAMYRMMTDTKLYEICRMNAFNGVKHFFDLNILTEKLFELYEGE